MLTRTPARSEPASILGGDGLDALNSTETTDGWGNETGSQPGAEIRIVFALTNMNDERTVMNAYSDANPIGAQLMAKVTHLGDLVQTATDYDATIVLLDHQMGHGLDAGELMVTAIQKLRHHPEHPIAVIGVCYDPSWKKTFEEAGALGTINGPITTAEIARLNALLPGVLQKVYLERQSPNYINHFSDGAARIIDAAGWKRRKLGVWSPKGGVGKTFWAREVSVLLGVLCDLKVLLIDADMNCGDVATYMGVSCDRGGLFRLAQLFHSNGHLTPLMLTQCMTPYATGKRVTNLQVLTGAYKMSMAGDPMFVGDRGARFANALLDLVDTMTWDFVIFDLGQSFHHPMHLMPLRRNDFNFVIGTSEKATAIELMYAIPELTKRVQISPDRFNLVLNKWDDSLGVDAKELVTSLKLPQFARVPYEEMREVNLSCNQSRPLVLDPPGAVSNAIANAVISLYPPLAKVWASRGGNAKAQKQKFQLFRKR